MKSSAKKAASLLTFALSLCLGASALALWTWTPVPADAAAGDYYAPITAQSGTALLGQVHDLIVNTHKTYTSYDDCKRMSYIEETDPSLDGEGILEFYTHETMTTGFGSSAGILNREHVWPKSLGNWETSNAGADLHHIRPTETRLNGDRGNKKYGEVTNGTPQYSRTTSGANSQLGGYANSSTFMPLDNVKGDAARIVMYVYTHYNTASRVYGTKESRGSGPLSFTNIISAGSESAAIDLLLEWNESDPVDAIETTRNEAVYKIQGNRNPFIDHPEYAEAIWGDGTAVGGGGTDVGGGQGGTTEPATPAETFHPITEPEEGTYYLGMNVNGTYYYAQSQLVNNYYIGTTTDINSASEYTLTKQGDGWIIKTGSKYLELPIVTGTDNKQHPNPKFNSSQTSGKTWTWDASNNIFTWTDGDDTAFLGNYNGKTSIAGAFISYINSDYPAQLGTYGTGGTQGGGTVDPDPVDPDPDPNPVDPGPVTPTGDTFTITLDSFDLTEGYGFKTWSAGGVSGTAFIFGGSGSFSNTGMQFNKSKESYYLASTTAAPGAIRSVTVKLNSGSERPWKLLTSDTAYGEVAGKPTDGTDRGTKTVTADGVTWTLDGDDTYFALTYELEDAKGVCYLESIVIEYEKAAPVDPEPSDPDTPVDPETPSDPNTPADPETPGTEQKPKRGCGGAVALSGVAAFVAAGAAVLFCRKKQ